MEDSLARVAEVREISFMRPVGRRCAPGLPAGKPTMSTSPRAYLRDRRPGKRLSISSSLMVRPASRVRDRDDPAVEVLQVLDSECEAVAHRLDRAWLASCATT